MQEGVRPVVNTVLRKVLLLHATVVIPDVSRRGNSFSFPRIHQRVFACYPHLSTIPSTSGPSKRMPRYCSCRNLCTCGWLVQREVESERLDLSPILRQTIKTQLIFF